MTDMWPPDGSPHMSTAARDRVRDYLDCPPEWVPDHVIDGFLKSYPAAPARLIAQWVEVLLWMPGRGCRG